MRNSRALCITAVALTGLLCCAGAAAAFDTGPGAGIPEPILIRITGYVQTAPSGETTLGPFTLGVGDKIQTLALTAVQMLNGPLTEGPAALRQYWLYNPNVSLVGKPELLRAVRSAPAQTKLTLFAYILSGTQRMLLVQVDQS